MNVETTPELILEAAEKCPQAKEALKTLFPKVFDNDILINVHCDNSNISPGLVSENDPLVWYDKEFGLVVNGNFDWVIMSNQPLSSGHFLLIPTNKTKQQ